MYRGKLSDSRCAIKRLRGVKKGGDHKGLVSTVVPYEWRMEDHVPSDTNGYRVRTPTVCCSTTGEDIQGSPISLAGAFLYLSAMLQSAQLQSQAAPILFSFRLPVCNAMYVTLVR